MSKYAITLRKNVKIVDIHKLLPSDYECIIDHIRNRGCTIDRIDFELDARDWLHIHGVITIPENVYRKELCIKPFHMHLRELKTQHDIDTWHSYCDKIVKRVSLKDCVKINLFKRVYKVSDGTNYTGPNDIDSDDGFIMPKRNIMAGNI